MNVSSVAMNMSYIIIQVPLCLYSALLIMICDAIKETEEFKESNPLNVYISSLYLIFTVHLMTFVLLSFFSTTDSNKAT